MVLKANPVFDYLADRDFTPNLFSLASIWVISVIPFGIAFFAFFLVFAPTGPEGVETPTGCSRLGLQDETNLSDEFASEYDQGSMDETTWKVKALFIYPIKSCGGVELKQSDVVGTGLKYDRQFAFARLMTEPGQGAKSSEPWKFVTQREFRLMSQVKLEMWVPDPKRPAYREDLPYVRSGGALIVRFPYNGKGLTAKIARLYGRVTGRAPQYSFIVPFKPTAEQLKRDYTQEKFTIWDETVTATNMGQHVLPQLRQYLGCSQPLTLMRVSREREVFRSAPRKEQHGWQPITGFADAFPLHILGLSSVHETTKRQPSDAPALTCTRFRANIYIAGMPPFEEDEWRRVQIGKQSYFLNCRCVRCTIPNIEPSTAVRHMSQPRKTLRETREVDKGAPGQGCLGMNMVPDAQSGLIRVGDSLKVLERGEQFYVY